MWPFFVTTIYASSAFAIKRSIYFLWALAAVSAPHDRLVSAISVN